MSILHCLAAYRHGNLSGLQSTQRDWSPFLAHFTTWSAMRDLRSAVKTGKTPRAVAELLDQADGTSFGTIQKIFESMSLRARSPSDKNGLSRCVCFSECSLPGLISHCERYGRFGLIFTKESIFAAGGRPCVYVGREEYTFIAESGRGNSVDSPAGRLFALTNLYEPRKTGAKVQDYTHEREWRIFDDLLFSNVRIEAVLAPSRYVHQLQTLVDRIPIVPIDVLFEWGA